jgi:hypothetical protein
MSEQRRALSEGVRRNAPEDECGTLRGRLSASDGGCLPRRSSMESLFCQCSRNNEEVGLSSDSSHVRLPSTSAASNCASAPELPSNLSEWHPSGSGRTPGVATLVTEAPTV